VIVGSRSYDLLALDGKTGRPAWTRYNWFSWVESTATIFDGSVYVGSSDAARLFAFEARTGQRIWEVDTGGSTWGQPAVTPDRVFAGAVGTVHYLIPHRASVLAVDRKTGRPAWRHPVSAPENPSAEVSCYGFAGSAALGEGFVYIGGLDGRVYAFAQ
jgi:outer membrane protein assembly factor BamB